MPVVYSAVRRFDPSVGEGWSKYIAWSGLTHLREVVSLDGILCPTIFRELTAEDWQHNVQENYKTHLFHDLDYVVQKAASDERVNILALLQNPAAEEVHSFTDGRFEFRGFDLVDVHGEISALVNCGGFDKAFRPADLSACGLLADHAKAMTVQNLLREQYPDEPHAVCDLWAIWQMRR